MDHPRADRIIYDVGGAYDADPGIFDHHQRGAPLRDDGQPLSSFGLIWRHYGRHDLEASGVLSEHIEAVHASFDAGFVRPIDLVDSGALSPASAGPLLSGMVPPSLMETLKPVFDDSDPEAEDRAFATALTIARAFVQVRMAFNAAKLRAEANVLEAIATAGDSRILERPMGMPFRPTIVKAGADQLWFVINPRGRDWTIGGIRRSEDGFVLRADLPTSWAGFSGQALEAATAVPGALFCHNGRFIAAAATREAAIAMAEIAVREAEQEP